MANSTPPPKTLILDLLFDRAAEEGPTVVAVTHDQSCCPGSTASWISRSSAPRRGRGHDRLFSLATEPRSGATTSGAASAGTGGRAVILSVPLTARRCCGGSEEALTSRAEATAAGAGQPGSRLDLVDERALNFLGRGPPIHWTIGRKRGGLGLGPRRCRSRSTPPYSPEGARIVRHHARLSRVTRPGNWPRAVPSPSSERRCWAQRGTSRLGSSGPGDTLGLLAREPFRSRWRLSRWRCM